MTLEMQIQKVFFTFLLPTAKEKLDVADATYK